MKFIKGNNALLYIFLRVFRVIIITAFIILFNTSASAQLTGVKTIPGDYATVAAAVTALNAAGVGVDGVIFNVAANHTETISATISLTATGTAANTIVFQKDPGTSGANPLITAYTGGTATPASTTQDGIWRLVGSDYVTIDGIDIRDNPLNTTNPATMEYGFALYKAAAANGCQYVNIVNCVITLNRINNATGTAPMVDGSTGILVVNTTATAAVTNLTITTSAGTNSNNSFYNNTVQNCNTGIAIIGFAAASPFSSADQYNDIGGFSAGTGNRILNYGGAVAATNTAVAIRTLAQYNFNVAYNTINNNNGSGVNHPTTLKGIWINTATSAGSDITNNTITLKCEGTTQLLTAIENASGSTAVGNEVNISNNTITNCTYTTATTGSFYGIYSTASAGILTINNNNLINNSTAVTATGLNYQIWNSGVIGNTININNNSLNGYTFTAATSAPYIGIYNSGGGTVSNLSISNNDFTGINYSALSTNANTFILNAAATLSQVISSNTFTNLDVNTTGAVTFISNSVIVPGTGNQVVDDNSIVGTFTRSSTATSGALTLFTSTAANATGSVISNSNNDFSNITVSGAATIAGWVNTDAGLSIKTIQGNTFSNWTAGTGTVTALTVNLTGTTNATVSNLISNISSGGVINGISTGAGNDKIYSNTISNLSSTGGTTTTVTGIYVSAGTSKNIYQNIISGLSANNGTTGNTTTLLTVNGIWAATGTTVGSTINIYENRISALTANAITTGTINGIAVTSGTNPATVSCYRNKIYDLASSSNTITTGGTNGFRVSGATANSSTTIRNNIIGDLRTTAANAVDPIRAINLIATGASSNIFVYYNTIYLNAVSSGTNFGTTGIYHAGSATPGLANLEMINNIILNNSTPNGTGLTVAYRRSNTNLINYGPTSNNNLYFAGTPGPTRLIYNDVTNSDQTLAAFKSRVATRDAASVTEDLIAGGVFLSTVGSSATYLHMDDTKSSVAKSGGITISGVSLDFDNDIRFDSNPNSGYSGTGTAPDIGADEYAGISYLPLSGTYNVGTAQTFTSLTNAGGLFAKINRAGLSGNVIVNITSDLTETGLEALNNWTETGIGNYSLTIQPSNTSARLISGDVLQGMIRLNGADRVTIDGGAGNLLTFRNTNTAGTTGTAITLINGASGNTIRRCNLEAFTDINNAVILFGTSATFDGGNSNNLVELCNINGTVSGNNAIVCVLSAGTNVPGFENSNNSILSNNIYNYKDRGLGIKSTGSYAWTISDNSIYNGGISGAITYAPSSTLHGMRILGGTGYTVTNNYIGGSAPLATGANATYATSTGNLSYQGILLNTSGAIPESNIKGNTIAKINISCFPPVGSSTVFIGIETNGSGINIGGLVTGEGNLIGSNNSNASINITTSTTTNTFTSFIRGIYSYSSGGTILGNQVGGIDIRNIGTAPAPSTFLGIYVNNAIAPAQINKNIIGSTGVGAASNSIQVLSTSTATTTLLTGISIGTSVGSVVQIDSNIVRNLSHLSTATVISTGGIIGINTAAKNTAELTITNNTVANCTNSSSFGSTGLLYGIQNTGASASVKINKNSFFGNTINSVASIYTPIRNTGVVFNTLEINENKIGNSSTAAVNYNAANSGAQIFIQNTGGSSSANLSISNNDFQNIVYTGNNGTGTNTYISNTAVTLSQTITGNSFTNLNVQSSGTTTFITNSVVVPASGFQNVSNNVISGTYTKRAGGTITFITSTATCATGSTINISNNDFSNVTVTGATVVNGIVNTDLGNSSKTIQSNTLSNWSGGTSAMTGMNINLTGTNNATSGNVIRNLSSIGTITGITTAGGNDNIFNNTIDSLFSTGTLLTIVSGINVTTGGTSKNIYQNTISNLQGNTLTTGSVRGILISGGATVSFYQNTIHGLTANALTTGTISGIWVSAGTTVKIFRNKLYDISSSAVLTGQVYGIQVSGATASLCTINNNIIGDLRATAANQADAIRGIGVISTGASSTTNVYYNTIYLNATSSGANFGTSGIYHTTSATIGTSTLNLINNIISNMSVKNGTGLTVAYRRSTNVLNNYGASSNNNLFYAGTPSASNLIFYDATNSDQTLAAFKLRVTTREAASITEDLIAGAIFLSTTGSAISYLHIDQNKITALRSAGKGIATFSDDFDGDIRFDNPGYAGNGTAPDIGADEFAGLQFLPFSGIYNVGTGQNYTSLTNSNGLFSKMNSLGFSGHVTINIISDLVETGAEALNQWTEFGAGNYTLKIQPDAATPRLISGNAVGGLIRFNGADRVKIDGGTSRLLTFRNTNATGTSGTAFTFINGASFDTIRYCNIEAYANATNGVILFSTAATGATANSNNLIEYNNINGTVASNTSLVSIYSAGTTGKPNATNVISNNNIFDFRDRAIDITATGSTGWTITNNSMYNGNVSGSVNYPASSELHGIRISGGTGYTISNNFIGGSATLATGSNATFASTLGNIGYQGIYLTTTGATPASVIKGNTIARFTINFTPVSSSVNAFTGIETNGTGISVGGVLIGEGNIIGSNSLNGSITVSTSTTSTVNTSFVRGINFLSTGGIVTANQVGGIDISNIGSAPAASTFSGIYINNATAPTQVNNNTIGSKGAGAASNSIRVLASSTAVANVIRGIEIGSSVASAVQVNANTVQNISNLSTTSSGSFTGIINTATVAGAVMTISNNYINNISSAANNNANSLIYTGINSSSPSTINNDTITNISLSSTGNAAQVRGIIVSGAFINTINNNILSNFITVSTKTADVETGAPSNYTIAGILNTASVAGQLIYSNTISNFSSTTTDVINTAVVGIGIGTAGFTGTIYNNRIVGFTNTSTGTSILPGITGIAIMNGTGNVYNNVIKVDNAANSNGLKLYGINHSATTAWNYFYNSIYIGGSATGTATRTAGFVRTVNGSVTVKNNLLINTRTGAGSHYGISNKVATPATNWTESNYNNIYSSTSGTTAEWGNGVNNIFSQWQTNSGGDANSVNRSVTFIISTYDLVPNPNSNCAINNAATVISSPIVIGVDINGVSRNATTPDMGAYEFSYIAFIVTSSSSSPICDGSNLNLFSTSGNAISPTFSWVNPLNAVVSTLQNPTVSGMAGSYKITVTDINGCAVIDSTIVTTATTPAITGSTPGSRCGTGTVSLSATASAGTINWYAASSGGSSLGTGTSFTTPSISTTTTYYVDATANGCITASRTPVSATINTIPAITGTTPATILGPGTVSLVATASAGTIDWFANATGGSSLNTGTNFTTPSISATTSYWVDATEGGCTTAARTEVIATVATINGTQNIVCPNEVVNFALSNTFDTYQWTVTGGTPTSGTSSNINVTWGTGNRGQLTIEAFNGGLSKGIISRRIYIDQPSAYTATADTNICAGGTASLGLSFTNKSLSLNGTSDYVGISNSALINLVKTDYRTVSMWFKANDVTTRQVLYNEGGATNGFSMYIEDGKVYVLAWESNSVWNAPNASINAGQWYNITFVFDEDATDGFHFKGYLDGVSIGEFNEGAKANNGMNAHSGPVAIGSNSNIRFHDNTTSANNYFNGKVDGFKLWNRSLSAAEILIEKDHWLSSPVIDAALDVYINFDNSVLDIADSPSAEDGALFGSPVYDDDAPLKPTIVWSPGGATTSTINVSPGTTTAYSYTLTEKLSSACGQSGIINVAVTPLPTITGTTPSSRCGTGTVTLGATASAGTINWFATSTGGTSLGTGTNFITPSISITTTYYVEAVTGMGCLTSARTAITATINPEPSATISYAGTPYCSANGTATVTFSGTTGGTYSSTAGLVINASTGDINLTASSNGTYTVTYSIAAAGSCSFFSTNTSVTITVAGIWTGAINNNWNLAGNWQCSTIPDSTINVIIPTGLTNYPVLSTGIGKLKDLTIQTGATLTISNAVLQIARSISNAGIIYTNTGSIELNGTIAQTIPAGLFSGNLIKDLTINNNAGVTLGGTVHLINDLTVSNGSLTTGGYLRLLSTDTTMARVAEITSGAATPINGNVIVERYIKGRRKYRIMTSSVTTSPAAFLTGGQEGLSIWGHWQNQGNTSTTNNGTFITGGSVANGYDQQTPNASMFTYNSALRQFEGFTTANGKNTKYTPLKAGVPYFMFVYGDRTNSAITSSPNWTTFIATGTLLTGNQTYNTGSSIPLSNVIDGYTMIGNPYASSIDWASVSRTNIEDSYWGWDPNLSSTGGYVTVNTAGSVTLIAPFSGTVGLNQYIQPGQGFFVKTSASAPVLVIKESDKVSNFNGNAFRTTANNIKLIAINLLYDDATGRTLMDGVLAAFDSSFSNQIGKEDASKIYKAGEALSIESHAKLLSITGRKLPSQGDTLLLNIAGLTKPQYKLQVFMNQLEQTGLEPYLKDAYLNTSVLLSLTDTNYINFSINTSIPATFSANRFYIVFRQSGAISGVITSINAKKLNYQVQLDWGVSSEAGIQKYEIQREESGNGFVKIGEMLARGINGQQYQWIDMNPKVGINQYRIKLIYADGSSSLSKIVSANITEEKPAMKIYPNPVKNYVANILFTNLKAGKYELKLFNLNGQMVMSQSIEYNGSSSSTLVSFSRLINPGLYIIHLNDEKIKISQKILIE